MQGWPNIATMIYPSGKIQLQGAKDPKQAKRQLTELAKIINEHHGEGKMPPTKIVEFDVFHYYYNGTLPVVPDFMKTANRFTNTDEMSLILGEDGTVGGRKSESLLFRFRNSTYKASCVVHSKGGLRLTGRINATVAQDVYNKIRWAIVPKDVIETIQPEEAESNEPVPARMMRIYDDQPKLWSDLLPDWYAGDDDWSVPENCSGNSPQTFPGIEMSNIGERAEVLSGQTAARNLGTYVNQRRRRKVPPSVRILSCGWERIGGHSRGMLWQGHRSQ